MDGKGENISVKKLMSPCDVEALKKCLEENKGDYVKCQSQIEAFKSSCSMRKPNSSADSEPKPKTAVEVNSVKFTVTRTAIWLGAIQAFFVTSWVKG